MDYHMSEASGSEDDANERLEELYNDAKAERDADSQLCRFDDLLSTELKMQKKTVRGFKASKRLLKSAIEQSNLDASIARYRQLLSDASSVSSNDFDGCVLKIVGILARLSQTEILSALLSIVITDATLTNASVRTAAKLAQSLVRVQPNGLTLSYLIDLQNRLEGTNDVAKMTTNRCLLELYVLEMELFLRMGRFEHMDLVYHKAMSMEDTLLGSQQLAAAHGYYGRYLLRRDKPLKALAYLVKAVEGYAATSIGDEQHTACVQSLALAAYTSVVDNADNPANSGVNEALSQFSGRPDVTAIRRFAMAFLNADVAALDSSLDEIEGTFKHCEILRLLRHYETLLKRKLFLKTSPLPADCWSDILLCLTHPIWHELQTLCRKFDPVLAPLLHHLHSDVQKARFEHPYTRWHITVSSKSGRPTKVVHHNGILSDAVLASAVMQDVMVAEIRSANAVTNEGIVRFCFGGDNRRLDISQPQITRCLFAQLVQEHSSAVNDHEFTLIVTCSSDILSDVRRQTTASQYRVGRTDISVSCRTYELPSGSTLFTIKFALHVGGLDTMTVIRKRLTV